MADAAAAGIHCLALPTPFAVGTVNCFLLEGDPLALIDCGPNSPATLLALERELEARGYKLADIGLVVVSHQHMDHLGLVQTLVQLTGAEVACIDVLADYVEHYDVESAADDLFGYETMLRHGVAPEVVQSLRSSTASRRHAAAAPVRRPLPAGALLELPNHKLQLLHRPGHSPSDTVFWDVERRIAIVADHLLRDISSNALIANPLPRADASTPFRPLIEYRQSLRATHQQDVALTLTGHGDPVLDHRALIDRRLAGHERRATKLHQLLLQRSPRTVRDLAIELFGARAFEQPFLTTSEVLGHLELLEDEHQVVARERDGRITFSPS